MAAKQQMSGEGFTSHIAGMSKNQLYDIMSQMKVLIEQNQQQARQILIDNPQLTRALFQAQIMLGMVQPPEVMPNIQKTLSQAQNAQVGHQPNAQTTQPGPVQGGSQGQATSSQPFIAPRQQHPAQPSISLPTVSAPPLTFQSQPMTSNPPHSAQQTKGFPNAPQVPSVAPPPSSQIHNMPLPPPPAPPHYSIVHQPHMPMISGQMQQSIQTHGLLHQPLQPPPLPHQPRPPSMQPFSHHSHSQMAPGHHGFQGSSVPQLLLSQPMFHSSSNPPTLFPQGQPTFPVPQQLYQGGPHLGPDYGNHAGTSMHGERGTPWAPGLPEKAIGGAQLMGGPPPLGQMAPSTSGQPSRPAQLTPEMEKALLQQVMSLTPEQINLLPPEQRQQVIQLQEMLR